MLLAGSELEELVKSHRRLPRPWEQHGSESLVNRACRDPHMGTVAITQEEDSNFAISHILLLLCCPSPGGSSTGTRKGKGSHVIVPSTTHYLRKSLALGGYGGKEL